MALQLFDDMPKAQLAPNLFVYNAAISSCEKANFGPGVELIGSYGVPNYRNEAKLSPEH